MSGEEELVVVPVPREHFVAVRYENWHLKKLMINRFGLEDKVHMTDLDRTYKDFDKPMSEVVICDCCNQDILDDEILMSEEHGKIFHRNCLPPNWTIDDFMENMLQKIKIEQAQVEFPNVISLASRRLQR